MRWPAPARSYPNPAWPTGTQRALPLQTPATSNTKRPSPTPTSSPPTPPQTEPPLPTTTRPKSVTNAKQPPQPRQLPRPVPYQSSPQPLPRPPPPRLLTRDWTHQIGSDRRPDRRATARRSTASSQKRSHHAAESTPRPTTCLTALSRQPLLTLSAAPHRRGSAPRAPREPRWTPT